MRTACRAQDSLADIVDLLRIRPSEEKYINESLVVKREVENKATSRGCCGRKEVLRQGTCRVRIDHGTVSKEVKK